MALARSPVDSRDPFLCNKTTHRTVYESQRASWPDAFDVLLFNGLLAHLADKNALDLAYIESDAPRSVSGVS